MRAIRPLPLVCAALLIGCQSPPSALPVGPATAADSLGSEQSYQRALALARAGAPSPTPELDALASQIATTTSSLGLAPILSPVGAAPPLTRIRPGDLIGVTVYGQDDLSGERRVNEDGAIQLFLLGRVEVAGLTASEAAERVRTGLEASYVKPAQVLVWVKERSKAVAEIVGRVREPGTKPLEASRRLSVHGILTLAQGLLSDADGAHLALVRTDAQGRQRCYHFSYAELAAAYVKGRQAWLQPDDLVVVPRLPTVFVVGAVEKQGAYPLRPGTTVASLIALAGPSERADSPRVQVLAGQGPRLLGLDGEVQAGEVVFVPERQRVYLVGPGVTKNGPVDFPASGLTVVQAVAEAGWFSSHADLNKVEILRYENGRQTRLLVPVEEILDGELKASDYPLKPGDLVFVPETIF